MKIRLTFILFISLALTACSSVSLSGLWSLRNVEPETIDPAIVRIAAGFSDDVIFNSVDVSIGFDDEPVEKALTFNLVSLETPEERSKVPFISVVKSAYVLAVPPEKQAAVRAFQQARIKRQNAGKSTSGALSINADIDLKDPENACEARLDRMRISSALLVDTNQGYVPLNKSSRLSKMIEGLKPALCKDRSNEEDEREP